LSRGSLGALLIVLGLALPAQGCGAESSGSPQAAGQPRSDRLVDFSKKPPYVNALDVDPQDSDLLLTTNKGFWRIDPVKDTVARVRGTVTAGSKSSPNFCACSTSFTRRSLSALRTGRRHARSAKRVMMSRA